MIRYYNKENFDQLIEKRILVDFYATWCGPCKLLGQVLENIEKDVDLDIMKVDIDKYPELARRYKVMSVPTMILFDKGQEEKKNIGFMGPEELKEFVK